MEIGVSREPGDGKGQELAAGRGGICSSFPPGTLWWSVATFPRPAARLGSCQENSFCVSLNIPLLLGGKKHQPKPELLLLLELASWLNWAFFFSLTNAARRCFSSEVMSVFPDEGQIFPALPWLRSGQAGAAVVSYAGSLLEIIGVW